MNNKFQIAIDAGKHSNKSIMKEGEVIHRVLFRNKVQEVDSLGAELSPNSYKLQFEGKTYLLGDMLPEERTSFDLSKNSFEHILSIYVAITQLLLKSKQSIGLANIYLAVNIPVSLYKNEDHMFAFQEAIRRNGEPICIAVNGKTFAFKLQSVLLLPEAIGPTYLNTNEFRNKKILVMDIGSLNTNFMEIDRLVPKFDRMVSSNLGVNVMRAKLADTLTTKYGIAITDDDCETIIRDKYLIVAGQKREDSREIIEKLFSEHVAEIVNFAKSRKISFNNLEIVLVGGGSILLRNQLISEFPGATISPEAQFANVLSFLKVLEAKHNGQA